MKKFNPAETCEKCGGLARGIQFIPRSFGDILRITCHVCGFVFTRAPLDTTEEI